MGNSMCVVKITDNKGVFMGVMTFPHYDHFHDFAEDLPNYTFEVLVNIDGE